MVVNAKQKGKRGELEVVKKFGAYGFTARRGVQYAGRGKSGEEAPDVIVEDAPWLHVEVKREQKIRLDSYFEQMDNDAKDNQVPVCFHRYNEGDWRVFMHADDFLDLLRLLERHVGTIKVDSIEEIGLFYGSIDNEIKPTVKDISYQAGGQKDYAGNEIKEIEGVVRDEHGQDIKKEDLL